MPRWWRQLDNWFDAAFGSAASPLRQLGALGFVSGLLLAASGIVLYAVLDTSASGAYRSIAEGGWAIGFVRSLHRYAADAWVLLMALHLLREALAGHMRFWRRWSWWTGVALIVMTAFSAIGGFWLHWDRLGQYSAVASAEWLDTLPLLAAPLARNFLGTEAVSDRLFSLFVFVHIGMALMIVLGIWLHLQRLAKPAVWPPARVLISFIATLALLAVLLPVRSDAPADLASEPVALPLDWLLLALHPLAEVAGAGMTWALIAGAFIVLVAWPMATRRARPEAAVVDAANCNGCRRCLADCPFAAVTMQPHPLRHIGRELAHVDAALCAGCGICAGACPSSTPFRSTEELVTGIDLPQAPIGALRTRLRQALAASKSRSTLVVFGCDHGVPVAPLVAPDVAAFSLVCAAALPPAFVDYALRDGAAGVLVSGCSAGACEYRLGQQWCDERLRGQREPQLRGRVERNRLELAWLAPTDAAGLHAALQRLRTRVQALSPRQVQHA